MVTGEAPGSPAELVGSMYLTLYGELLSSNLLSFRGGDVFEIANVIEKRGIKLIQEPFTDESGSDNMFIVDPDGNILYFNTYPQERLY